MARAGICSALRTGFSDQCSYDLRKYDDCLPPLTLCRGPALCVSHVRSVRHAACPAVGAPPPAHSMGTAEKAK